MDNADEIDPTTECGFICTLCGIGERCDGPGAPLCSTTTRDGDRTWRVHYTGCRSCRAIIDQLAAEGAWNARSPWTMRAALIAGGDPIAAVRAESKALFEKAGGRKPRHLTTVP